MVYGERKMSLHMKQSVESKNPMGSVGSDSSSAGSSTSGCSSVSVGGGEGGDGNSSGVCPSVAWVAMILFTRCIVGCRSRKSCVARRSWPTA